MVRRRACLRLLLVLLFTTILIYHALPNDNTLFLAIRWNRIQLTQAVSSAFSSDPTTLLTAPSSAHKYAIREADIGTIINTGWNPREKLEASLRAMGGRKSIDDVVVVADYESEGTVDFKGGKVKVYDVLGGLLEDGWEMTGRLRLYLKWKKALEDGDFDGMRAVSGKELDIIKHVPGLELGYEKMPSKKWYLVVDDDTYIHMPSLLLLLSTLDHRKPYYLGNAVGDFRSRFGHGGSAILFSSGAMHKIFVQNAWVVKEARRDSLTAEYGDEVIAKMAQRAGVFLSEDHSLYFNGEPPRQSFIRADRICTAIVSFHKQTAEQINEDFQVLGKLDKPIAWGEIGGLFGGPKVDDPEDGKIQREWDFVGTKEHGKVMVVKGVRSSAHCALMCTQRGRICLAWTFEKEGRCAMAPWYSVGEAVKGKASGLNKRRIQELLRNCKK